MGQDFPLRTNFELSAAFKASNDSNLIESFPYRWAHGLGERDKATTRSELFSSFVELKVLPFTVTCDSQATWYKGSIYGVYRREFLEEAVLGGRVQPIRSMVVKHAAFKHPDELFFPTLAYNSHLRLPGACLTSPMPSSETRMHFLGKYVIWSGYDLPCNTKYVRGVCILGKEHVDALKRAAHISANKFHADYEQEAYDEMERWYFEKVRTEITTGSYSRLHFDPSVYASLSCSRNHIWGGISQIYSV